MKLAQFLSGLGRPVAYYAELARFVGSVGAAIFLQQLFYWRDRATHEYIYKTSANIEEETGLSYKEQKTARRKLVALGILQEKHARLQHEMHWTINEEALNEAWVAWVKQGKPNRKMRSSDRSKCPKGISPTAQKAFRQLPKRQTANSPKGHSIPETTQRLPRDYQHIPPFRPSPQGEDADASLRSATACPSPEKSNEETRSKL